MDRGRKEERPYRAHPSHPPAAANIDHVSNEAIGAETRRATWKWKSHPKFGRLTLFEKSNGTYGSVLRRILHHLHDASPLRGHP